MQDFANKLLTPVRMASRAARYAFKEPSSAWLALRMASWVAALSLLMKLMPLPRALKFVATRTRINRRTADASAEQSRLAQLLDSVLAADFWFLTPTCWKRAPVLHRFLALKGIESRIVFGVRREGNDTLNGHAWLESRGEPLLEKSIPDYKITFSYPN